MKQKNIIRVVTFLVIFIILAVIIALSVSFRSSNKTYFNTGNVTGNTAGNLYNNGMFCEYDGKVYFSNSYDSGSLYVMDSDGSNITKLNDDTVSYINAYGKYLYYARNNLNESNIHEVFRINMFGVYRLDLDGDQLLCLTDDTTGTISLSKNTIYYQSYNTKSSLSLKSVQIDGAEKKDISNNAINPSCIIDGTMYYYNVEDNHNLMAMNIDSGSTSTVYQGASYNPIFDDGYVYFIDVEQNYSLSRFNLSTHEKEDIYPGRIDTYNLDDNYIYIQVNDSNNPALCRIKKDGSDIETILAGNFSNINVTSEYIYFNQFGLDTPIYRMKTNGDLEVTRFDEAANVVKKIH